VRQQYGLKKVKILFVIQKQNFILGSENEKLVIMYCFRHDACSLGSRNHWSLTFKRTKENLVGGQTYSLFQHGISTFTLNGFRRKP